MADITETSQKNQRYNALLSQVTKSLSVADDSYRQFMDQLELAGASETGVCHPKERLKALDNLAAEMALSQQDISEFISCGSDLIAILELLDCQDTPKAHEIRQNVEDAKAHLAKMATAVEVRRAEILAELQQWTVAEEEIQNIVLWLDEANQRFQTIDQSVVDKNNLNDFIGVRKQLESEAVEYRHKIGQLIDRCRSLGMRPELCGDLSDRCHSLINCVNKDIQQLETVRKITTELHDAIFAVQNWISNTLELMESKLAVGIDTVNQRTHIENLSNQIRTKRKDLDAISDAICGLASFGSLTNESHFRSELLKVEGRWYYLAQQFAKFVSSLVADELKQPLPIVINTSQNVNQTSVNLDEEVLTSQLNNQKSLCKELEERCQVIEKCHETLSSLLVSSTDIDNIKQQIASAYDQIQLSYEQGDSRLIELSEAVPLACHLHKRQKQVEAWLGAVKSEVDLLEKISPSDDVEHVKVKRQSVLLLDDLVADYEPVIADLVAVAEDFALTKTPESRNAAKKVLDDVVNKFDAVKSALQQQITSLDSVDCTSFDDTEDRLAHLSTVADRLNAKLVYADPVMADTVTLRLQMAENDELVLRLKRLVAALYIVENAVKQLNSTSDNEQLSLKLRVVITLTQRINDMAMCRAEQLKAALVAAGKAESDLQAAMQSLQGIRSHVMSLDDSVVDVIVLQQHQQSLKDLDEELETVRIFVETLLSCNQMKAVMNHLPDIVSSPHIQKITLENLLEEVIELIRNKRIQVDTLLDCTRNCDYLHQNISKWLGEAEKQLLNLSPVAGSERVIRIQMEELKVLRIQMQGWSLDILAWTQSFSQLKSVMSLSANIKELIEKNNDIIERWSELNSRANEREADLRASYIQLGNTEDAIDNVMEVLQQTEDDLVGFGLTFGDAHYIELQLKKLEVLNTELTNQKSAVSLLEKAVVEIIERSGTSGRGLQEKLQEAVLLLDDVEIRLQDKQLDMQNWLKKLKNFTGRVAELMRWLNTWRRKLRHNSTVPLGALVDTARSQLDQALVSFSNLDAVLSEISSVLAQGEDMLLQCKTENSVQLVRTMDRLKSLAEDTLDKANRSKLRLESHVRNVEMFHQLMQVQIDWLSEAETRLSLLKRPSRVVAKIQQQMNDHQALQDDIDVHREPMKRLDLTGTYFKYRGSRGDICRLGDMLMAVRLRWKHLIRRCMESGNQLRYTYQQDKRFANAWSSLCDWLDDAECKLQFRAVCSGSATDASELQRIDREMAAHLPVYCTTRRAGTSLREQCSKTGEGAEERKVIIDMLATLTRKWNSVRMLVGHSRGQELTQMMASGRTVDTVEALLRWLDHASIFLSDSQVVYGDLDTVSRLIDQHQEFQKEAIQRKDLVEKILESSAADDRTQQLTEAWELVRGLEAKRWDKLNNALRLATEFNESLDSVLEWLPLAEGELAFRSIPTSKNDIVHMLENHNKFDEELRCQAMFVDQMVNIGKEILASCHCDARRAVEYHVRAITARWQQVLQRSSTRMQQLKSAIDRIHSNVALADSLLSWVIDVDRELMSQKPKKLPHDVDSLKTLIRQHLNLHRRLEGRCADVDRVRRLFFGQSGSSAENGTETSAPVPPAAIQLRDKWLVVWQTSCDRLKQLREALREANSENRKSSKGGSMSSKQKQDLTADCRHRVALNEKCNNASKDSKSSPQSICNMDSSPASFDTSSSVMADSVIILHNQKYSTNLTSLSCSDRLADLRCNTSPDAPSESRNDSIHCTAGRSKVACADDRPDCTHTCLSRVGDHPKPHSAGCSQLKQNHDRNARSGGNCRSQVKKQNLGMTETKCLHGTVSSYGAARTSSRGSGVDECDNSDTASDHSQLGTTVSRISRLVTREPPRPCRCNAGRPVADAEQIEQQIRAELARCTCPGGFVFERVDEGKYKYGNRGRLCLMRIVNSTVTVRVGGGWMQLAEFLDTVDVCRVHHRPKLPSPDASTLSNTRSVASPPEELLKNTPVNPRSGVANDFFSGTRVSGEVGSLKTSLSKAKCRGRSCSPDRSKSFSRKPFC